MPTKKRHILSSDWLAGLVFSVLFLAFAFWVARAPFYRLETAAYDQAMRWSAANPSDRIAVIAIDDASLDFVGRWPWSRDVWASFIDSLHSGGPKVVALAVLFSEPQFDTGQQKLQELLTLYENSTLPAAAGSADGDALNDDIRKLGEELRRSVEAVQHDRLLAESFANAGNVILGLTIETGIPRGRPDSALPQFAVKNLLRNIAIGPTGAVDPVLSNQLTLPITELGESAMGLGHLNQIVDADGRIRFEPLVVKYYDDFIPSLALSVTAKSLNLDTRDITVTLGESIALGNLEIRTASDLRMFNNFYADKQGEPAFSVDSFYDVWTGLIPVDKFHGKIVLIGPVAAGTGGDFQATPVSPTTAPIMVLAHTVSSILQEDFYTRPEWSDSAELGILLVLVLYLIVVLPRLKAGLAAVVTAALLVSLAGAEFWLLLKRAEWLQLMTAAALLITGHFVITVKRFRVTERLKLHADAEGAESNKMLGLAFQSQGQLDIAFDKFRKCPLDDALMEPLYNLALDFERKRLFAKAGSVYSHIAEHDIGYRDVKDRLTRSQKLEETMILGVGSFGDRRPVLVG